MQFMDCSNCGKRVRTTAIQCHHCQQPIAGPAARQPKSQPKSHSKTPQSSHQDDYESSEQESHNAISGGYDPDNDDFDYDEYLAEEFPDPSNPRPSSVKPWVWITAWVLIAATLLPFVYYFLVNP